MTVYPTVPSAKHFDDAEKQDIPCFAAINCSRKDTEEARQKGFTFSRYVKWLVVPFQVLILCFQTKRFFMFRSSFFDVDLDTALSNVEIKHDCRKINVRVLV